MKAYKHLVKFALNNGAAISVWDGEEWQVIHNSGYKTIISAIESVEIAELKIIDRYTANRLGWAQIIPFGVEDDETVSDYTITDFMNAWENSYNPTITLV